MAPAESGENILVSCENGDYFADYDAASGIPRPPIFPEPQRLTPSPLHENSNVVVAFDAGVTPLWTQASSHPREHSTLVPPAGA